MVPQPEDGLINPILVLIEGDDERRPVVKGLGAAALPGPHNPWRATMADGTDVIVVTTGVGPEQARRVTSECITRFNPGFVVSTGTCGALVPGLEMSDWLVTGEVRALGMAGEGGRPTVETLKSPAADAIARLGRALNDCPRRHAGRLVTVADAPVVDALEKEAIARDHGAVAVDMESHGIASAAAERNIPWLIARVVIDTPARPLPELGPMNRQTGRPPLTGIAWYVLRNPISGPRTLHGLWALVQEYARHLVRVLPAICGHRD